MDIGRFAFLKAGDHAELLHQAFEGFASIVPQKNLTCSSAPDFFTVPRIALDLAKSGYYTAIIACCFAEAESGWGHEYLAQAVSNGLMKVSIDIGVPIFPLILLTTDSHAVDSELKSLRNQCYSKGKKLGQAAIQSREQAHAILSIKDTLARLWPM